MKNAIILHGRPDKAEYYDSSMPSASNSHWLPWLQAQLLKHDIAAATPEVPRSYDQHWPTWNQEFERFDLTPGTTLVGHSTGSGFIIKYLSIHPEIRVGKVVLVAPWLDPFAQHTKGFFDDFEIDPLLVTRTAGVTIFGSDNDMEDVQETVERLRHQVKNIQYREFHHYGHFCYEDMKTAQFPELLGEILR